jgi:hypothetical protein
MLNLIHSVAGICKFFMKSKGKCDFGLNCCFAHDEGTITAGVRNAMRGEKTTNRGRNKETLNGIFTIKNYVNLTIP